MENKVFYGEYTLRHWINMILRKELLLPEYQRFFVWKEKKTDFLIETLLDKAFGLNKLIEKGDIYFGPLLKQ